MPHVIVKLVPGKSEEQKTLLAQAITRDITSLFHQKEDVVSVSFEEVTPEDWAEKVYRPDILEKPATLYKKPGYNPFEK